MKKIIADFKLNEYQLKQYINTFAKKEDYDTLKKMSYDGRDPDVSWTAQNIKSIGYHYYMTPETAELGLKKLPLAITTEPKKWAYTDWVDLTTLDVFKKGRFKNDKYKINKS